MNLWDFIKSKLFRKKETLPEAQIDLQGTPNVVNQVNNGFDNSVKIGYTPKLQKESYTPSANTLESALQQYLFGIMQQYNNGRTFNSYSVLTSLCDMETTNPGQNLQKEINFINRLEADKKAIITNQPTANGGVCFRHIQHDRNASNTDRRLYVNCKRENIAELAGKFYKELGDTPYYFKFCTDEQVASRRRSEQFVFYVSSEPHEMNRVIQTIQKTRQKYPKLFEGSKYMNPFMRDVDGFIGYAPDVKEGIYSSMDGTTKPIDKSYNTLLSEALSDSFIYAMRDVVAHDYELTRKTNGEIYERAYPYIRDVLEDVLENPEHQRRLIERMKINLEKCTQKNPLLSIKGLEQDKIR